MNVVELADLREVLEDPATDRERILIKRIEDLGERIETLEYLLDSINR
jgi:hypothetical protein